MDAPFSYGYSAMRRDLSDELLTLIGDSASFLSLVNMGSGRVAMSHKHEYNYDSVDAEASTVATAVATAVATSIVVADASKFTAGTIARFESPEGLFIPELVRVTACDTETNTLTVVRGHAGSTAAAIPKNTLIFVNTKPQVEASDASLIGDDAAPSQDHNFTEIFDLEAVVPGSMEKVYGISGRDSTDPVGDALDYYQRRNMILHAQRMRNAALFGRRFERTGKTIRGTMGGLLAFAMRHTTIAAAIAAGANIIDAKGNPLSKTMKDDAFEKCRRGGATSTDTALCNINQARNLTAIQDSKIMILRQESGATPGRMGNAVWEVVPDFPSNNFSGQVAVEIAFPKDMLWIGPRAALRLVARQGRAMADWDSTPKGADYIARRSLGEYTLEVDQIDKVGCLIVNLSPTVIK